MDAEYYSADSVDGITSGRTFLVVKRAVADISASTFDSVVVPAVAGKRIHVLSVAVLTGGTATTCTFNSKGAGAGTAISMQFQNGANGGAVLPYNPKGWFVTAVGEALTASTGAGSQTGIQVTYVEV